MLKPELTAIAQMILEQNYNSDEPAATLLPLKGGEWSAAYRFSFDGLSYVIRLSHTPDNFFRDKVSAQWSSPSLPIPRIIKTDRYQDQYYAISPYYPGVAFEHLSAADLERTIPDFLSMMTALQQTKLEGVSGFGTLTPAGRGAYNSWSEALLDVCNDHPDNLNHGWKEALAKFQKALRKVDQFYEQLTKLVQYCPEQNYLIHSDLLYQNLLVENHEISAVLDWGCAMIGDPAYDLALFSFFEPWFPAFTQVGLIEKMQQAFLALSPGNGYNFKERILAYQTHLSLGNIAYCVFSGREKDLYDHINRLEEVLWKAQP